MLLLKKVQLQLTSRHNPEEQALHQNRTRAQTKAAICKKAPVPEVRQQRIKAIQAIVDAKNNIHNYTLANKRNSFIQRLSYFDSLIFFQIINKYFNLLSFFKSLLMFDYICV
jgi:hypothetical protein